jgi:hypothetical protein
MTPQTPRAISPLSRLTALALLLGAFALPATAGSSASSASSDSVSTSVGSSSTSIQTSSESSTGDNKVADGDYRVIEVAEAPARAGTVRLKLHAVAQQEAKQGEFFLYMPQEAYDQSRLGQGSVVTARARAYGLEFANAKAGKPFFLVLADEWFRELQNKIVRL